MMTEVNWKDEELSALGRNGYMKCRGLEFVAMPEMGKVYLSVINSRGNAGRCTIEFPIQSIPEICEALMKIHAETKEG